MIEKKPTKPKYNQPKAEIDGPSEMLRTQLHEAAEIIVPEGTRIKPLGNAPHLLRVATPDGDRVIRRWESDATVSRIAFTAKALDLANAAGVERLPTMLPIAARDGSPSLSHGGHLYTISTWQDGRPFARYGGFRTPDGDSIDIPMPQATPVEKVTLDAARTLGQFHVATRELASSSDAPRFTLNDFLTASRRQWSNDKRILGDKAAGSTEIRRWLRCGNRVMAVGGERLEAAAAVLNETTTVLHGELWPTHLLVSQDSSLVGITGWSAVTTGSPVLDLAQLGVHVKGWSAALAEELIGAYHDVSPLTPEQRRSLPVVAALDLVNRVARMLHLAYLDEAMIGHESTAVLRSAIRILLPSLETLTNVLSPPEPRKFQPARLGGGGASSGPRKFGARPTKSGPTGSTVRSPRDTQRGTRKGS